MINNRDRAELIGGKLMTRVPMLVFDKRLLLGRELEGPKA